MSARVSRKRRIHILQLWSEKCAPKNFTFGKLQNDRYFLKAVYMRTLTAELIQRIQKAPENVSAMQVIRDYYEELDEVLRNSDADHVITHQFIEIHQELLTEVMREMVNADNCIKTYMGEEV